MTELEPTRTYSNLTATERLRAMLDERGVEWEPSVFDPQHETFYSVENGVGFIVTEFPEIQRMSLACDMRITPEQAIATTLGATDAKPTQTESSGKLTADDVRDLIERHSDATGGNGRDFHNGAYVAIADELNATLGSCNCSNDCTNSERTGTCQLKPWEMERDTGFYDCMECACGYVADVADWAEWHFCPNCGRRIEVD